MSEVRLPRAKRVQKGGDDKLYLIDSERDRVKVHYVGYDSSYDEWRESGDVVPLDSPDIDQTFLCPFSLYAELGLQIKQALSCSRKQSPTIRIDMSFDILLFNGGLKVAGVPSKVVHGTQRYKINHFRNLTPLLGSHWHFRGLNNHGDYGYVILETVE